MSLSDTFGQDRPVTSGKQAMAGRRCAAPGLLLLAGWLVTG